MVTHAVWTTAAVTLLAGVAACSNDKKDTPAVSGTPASRICDGALDGPAESALRRLGGTDRFQELAADGDKGGFSLDRAAAHLHDSEVRRSKCTVYVPGDSSGAPLVDLDFQAADSHPTRKGVEKAEPDRRLTFYPLGVYAATSNENSTALYFACSTKGQQGTTPYVNASMYSSKSQLKGDSTSKDRMVVLTSVARRLAEKLGCADEAHLPATVPDGEPVTP